MTKEEAEEYAKTMTYRNAVYNLTQAKCIPYRRATLIKVYELLDILDKIRDEIEECKQYRGMTENPVIDKHNLGLDKYYDLGLEKAIKIIDKYTAE